MKITRRDLGVIMILVGVMSIFLVYQMSFKDMQAQVEAVQTEEKDVKTQIDELQPIVDNAPFYQSEMEKMAKEVASITDEFPVNILYEDGIAYTVELENQLGVTIPSFTTTEAAAVSNVEGAGSLAGHNYALLSSSLSFTYTVEDYDALKEFVDYIYSDKENKRLISSIGLSFDNKTGEISGSVVLGMYAFADGVKEYEEQEFPIEDPGVDCIFGDVEEAEEE